jgi:hypothetical protein
MIHAKTCRFLRWRLSGGLAAALIAAATLLSVNAESAHAASEIGPSSGAEVWCDAAANTISVRALVGAGDMYRGQWIRYRFWAKDLETGASFWLGGSYWRNLYHQRVGDPWYDPVVGWYPGQITYWAPNAPTEGWIVSGMTVGNGYNRYHVFAQYQWYSTTYGTYIGDARRETATYSNLYSPLYSIGTASAPDCYL